MTLHRLKCWPQSFAPLLANTKTFDLRRNDRDYQVGDVLLLQEWDRDRGYSGREVKRRVGYVLRGEYPFNADLVHGDHKPLHGLLRGYAILGLVDDVDDADIEFA
jgi:Domain of unknown function (DUF3850)